MQQRMAEMEALRLERRKKGLDELEAVDPVGGATRRACGPVPVVRSVAGGTGERVDGCSKVVSEGFGLGGGWEVLPASP